MLFALVTDFVGLGETKRKCSGHGVHFLSFDFLRCFIVTYDQTLGDRISKSSRQPGCFV